MHFLVHSLSCGFASDQVCRFANLLKSLDVRKGDIVTIYMPMMVEIVYAMLACARIGAVHRLVARLSFLSFSACTHDT